MTKKKTPKVAVSLPPPGKHPGLGGDPSAWRKTTPLWSYRHVDIFSGRWSWDTIDATANPKIAARLKEYEAKTWLELSQMRSCGEIELERVCSDAKKRLRELHLDQYDALYHLRIDGPGRIWGIRTDRVFHLLWWDEHHSVYPINREDN